jgi:DNA polymerase-3 subunit alpha
MIKKMGFPTYMLIVAEFINWSKDHGVSVGPGRGSAAGSLVAWAMRITDVDPIPFGLMFERFLNPARVSLPDVDVDFCRARREDAIAHVREKYGQEKVGQILNYSTFKSRQALQDVARACGLGFEARMKLSDRLGDYSLAEAADKDPIVSSMYQGDSSFHRIYDLARAIEGLPRQTGVHAAGVVIASRVLHEMIPQHFDRETGRSMVGVEMKGAEKLGMVKFDFLGLKTLDILEEALTNIEEITGEKIDLPRLPLDDAATFRTLTQGDGQGLFQVESHGMRDLMKALKPDNIEELIALMALYRPGPIKSGMIDQFIECKHGRAPITYPHPRLEHVLKKTYGVMVYQEQVMGCARELAGFSLADADLLRRAMGKKDKKKMEEEKTKFIVGCEANKISAKDAGEIFDLIHHFSEYGFNASHSTAYGIISYQTAYLKTHHRAAYMASVMSWDADNHEVLAAHVVDLIRTGIRVLPPDIHRSRARFSVEMDEDGKTCVRYGLGAIKGLGESAIQDLLRDRSHRGAYRDLDDFLSRRGPKVTKASTAALAKAGALDRFGLARDKILRIIETETSGAKSRSSRKTIPVQQIVMFGFRTPPKEESSRDIQEAMDREQEDKKTRPWTWSDRLEYEKAVLGFWLSGHPLDRYMDLASIAEAKSDTLLQVPPLEPVSLIGVVHRIHAIDTKQGDRMTFVTLADRMGMVEVTVFPKSWGRSKAACKVGESVLVRGHTEGRGREGRVIAESLTPLAKVREALATTVDIVLRPEEARPDLLRKIGERLAAWPGKCRTRILIRDPHHPRRPPERIPLPETWAVSAQQGLFDEMERLLDRPDAATLPAHTITREKEKKGR